MILKVYLLSTHNKKPLIQFTHGGMSVVNGLSDFTPVKLLKLVRELVLGCRDVLMNGNIIWYIR